MVLHFEALFQTSPGLTSVNTALRIVRVQYRSFIGTAAKRSPEKPDPFPYFAGLGNAQIS
ncbi:hypothetical protein [Pedobacter kyonggii]|uniref:Uncharacterized protein n=1 Tax=Pedobacter kyonggii TaxID=1926871 RepID=A0A4Q9HEE6_9SPHI|nr:hypothetical protein [Pedobacter kyonggii]TBO42973.1 hypothetical protein EYS08_09275 [Pedobacter kyonggii]